MTSTIHPVILCGGSGTRLWPLSTPDRPKQFLPLTSDRSMIEETVARFSRSLHSDLEFASPIVVGSLLHEKELSVRLSGARKILEPFGRNSAPAVAAACLASDVEDLIIVLPADHVIRDVAAFHAAIATARPAAEDNAIVTFGVKPTHPATEYGYLLTDGPAEAGQCLRVEKFVEKPDAQTAQRYFSSGSYLWNAGIFLFRAHTMLNELEQFAPEVLKRTKAAISTPQRGNIYLDPTKFRRAPSKSIDYAVMERSRIVKTVPVSMGWSDVGGYRSLHSVLAKPDQDTVTRGPVHVRNSAGSYVHSTGPSIFLNGVSDVVVVATNENVLVAPISDSSDVASLAEYSSDPRYNLGFSSSLRTQAKEWLWGAFQTWSTNGWDQENGGFVERLFLDGTPDRRADRRTRVQARQVYCLCNSIQLGWRKSNNVEPLIERGLHFIDSKLRHPSGGWIHAFSQNGSTINSSRDLYDHAFLILAGSTAFQITGSELGLKIANDASDYIESELRDHAHGGWFETEAQISPRRANPHMHLFEAIIARYNATRSTADLRRLKHLVTLFETKLFDPASDTIGEYFLEDWSSPPNGNDRVFEPGHHYEWAVLLLQLEQAIGHDTGSWRRRLIRRADRSGINPKTSFAYNRLTQTGRLENANSRLWHQLEMFRAHLLHPDLASRSKTERILENIFASYLKPGPNGGWIDELDANGNAISKYVPASMLYHLVTAFAPLVTGRLL